MILKIKMKDYKKKYIDISDSMNKESENPLKVSYIFQDNTESKKKNCPIILIHGLFASIFSWRNNVDVLSRHNPIYALDLKGHGNSDKPKNSDYSPMALTLFIREFMNYLEIKKAVFVGNSLGGGISLLMALKFPSLVSKLVLLAPACYKQSLPSYIRKLKNPLLRIPFYFFSSKSIIQQVLPRVYFDNRLITEEVINGYSAPLNLKGTKSAFVALAKGLIPSDIDDIEKQVPTIKHKTLIIWGEEDRIIPLALAKRLHQEISHSTLHIIPQCGHAPQEEKPEIVNSLVTDFLKKES